MQWYAALSRTTTELENLVKVAVAAITKGYQQTLRRGNLRGFLVAQSV
jgi:hypothetical protein